MIKEQEFERLKFRQSGDSCVLASFAVAAHPFTKQPIKKYFYDYCRHFHIRSRDHEHCYCKHFPNEYVRRGISGYELIKRLYQSSTQKSFARCRRKFHVCTINNVASEEQKIAQALHSENPTALIVFLNNSNHSLVVFVGENGISFYDTNAGDCGNGLRSISELGNLGEGLLFSKI